MSPIYAIFYIFFFYMSNLYMFYNFLHKLITHFWLICFLTWYSLDCHLKWHFKNSILNSFLLAQKNINNSYMPNLYPENLVNCFLSSVSTDALESLVQFYWTDLVTAACPQLSSFERYSNVSPSNMLFTLGFLLIPLFGVKKIIFLSSLQKDFFKIK